MDELWREWRTDGWELVDGSGQLASWPARSGMNARSPENVRCGDIILLLGTFHEGLSGHFTVAFCERIGDTLVGEVVDDNGYYPGNPGDRILFLEHHIAGVRTTR